MSVNKRYKYNFWPNLGTALIRNVLLLFSYGNQLCHLRLFLENSSPVAKLISTNHFDFLQTSVILVYGMQMIICYFCAFNHYSLVLSGEDSFNSNCKKYLKFCLP